ncbi:hypothetical protein C2G38_2222078 [Gigaspora rosea]|uniref:Snurportin-1 n=1 Tax=Gigaspora rosea TaxID=44941 RepID=A0A397U2V9_9GLOM|nr:hypothetical protein C2G38_2222078 [Gigaspora rosea]
MANTLKDRNLNEHSSIENDPEAKTTSISLETTKETSQPSSSADGVEELHSTPSASATNEPSQPSPTVDEVIELFSTNFVSTTSGSFRQRTYKASPLQLKKREETQEERRARALEDQKKRRRDLTSHARNLALFKPSEISSDEDSEIEDLVTDHKVDSIKLSRPIKRKLEYEQDENIDHIFVSSKKARHKGKFRTSSRKLKKNPYSNQIMHAERMFEIPSDLEENWYVVLCPIGKRCIVISAKGKTVSRLRNGCEMNRFESPLPAGSSSYKGNKTSDYCILDCIYDQTTFTYYVLDMMCWKGHPIYDCDTEFRFYWLNTKLAEMDSPCQNTSTYTFTPLTAYTCHDEQISSLISYPDSFGYRPDGLLFFNKYTQYVLGDTPLCGWVGMENIEEIFGPFIQQKQQMTVVEEDYSDNL